MFQNKHSRLRVFYPTCQIGFFMIYIALPSPSPHSPPGPSCQRTMSIHLASRSPRRPERPRVARIKYASCSPRRPERTRVASITSVQYAIWSARKPEKASVVPNIIKNWYQIMTPNKHADQKCTVKLRKKHPSICCVYQGLIIARSRSEAKLYFFCKVKNISEVSSSRNKLKAF